MSDDVQSVTHTGSVPGAQPRLPTATAVRLPYSNGRRVGYGVLWAAWTVLLVVGGFAALFSSQVLAGLVGLVLGGLAGRYDYRIWTWRARRLLFFILY